MKLFTFDTGARIQFWCRTDDIQKAVDEFNAIISSANTELGLKITVDTYQPVDCLKDEAHDLAH